MSGLAALIRISRKDRIESFLKQGLISMATIEDIRKYEENDIIGDPLEGLIAIKHIKNADLTIGDIPLKIISGEAKIFEKGNMFCMYGISSELDVPLNKCTKLLMDGRNNKFGDSFVIIYKPGVFLKRAKEKLEVLGYQPEMGFVTYYDPDSYYGGYNVFTKQDKYRYQNEFRIFVKSEGKERISIKIGSIEDIAQISYDINELSNIMVERYTHNNGP